MRVIERRDPVPWREQVTCTGDGNDKAGCGSVLEVEESDLFRTERGYYDGSSDWFATFLCPVCGALTDISKVAVPTSVLNGLPSQAAWRRRKSARTEAYDPK